jgi:hypothetical protein
VYYIYQSKEGLISIVSELRGFDMKFFVYNKEIIMFLKMINNYHKNNKEYIKLMNILSAVKIIQIFKKIEFLTNFDLYFDMNFIYNSKGKI